MNFTLLSETVSYETPYFQILDREYQLPDGKREHYYVRKEVDTCCVLAMTTDGQFILEKEYRVGSDQVVLQLPAGRLESFEDDPDLRIKKELLEETGFTGHFHKIAEMPTSPYSTRKIHCYYATDCKKTSDQQLDSTEFIEVELVDKKKLKEFLLAGKSSSCAPGILAWQWMKEEGIIPDSE